MLKESLNKNLSKQRNNKQRSNMQQALNTVEVGHQTAKFGLDYIS